MELSHPAIGRLRTVKKVEDCLWTRSFTFQEPAQLAWRASADNKKANRCLRMRLSTFQELLIAASRAPLTAQGSERPAIGLVCANERTERRLRPRLWTFRTLLQSARSLSANRAKTDHAPVEAAVDFRATSASGAQDLRRRPGAQTPSV